MVEEDFELDDVLAAIMTAEVLEDYPAHRRGPCCLLSGKAKDGRPLHVVCATGGSILVIITVYEPRPPKWIAPNRRRTR